MWAASQYRQGVSTSSILRTRQCQRPRLAAIAAVREQPHPTSRGQGPSSALECDCLQQHSQQTADNGSGQLESRQTATTTTDDGQAKQAIIIGKKDLLPPGQHGQWADAAPSNGCSSSSSNSSLASRGPGSPPLHVAVDEPTFRPARSVVVGVITLKDIMEELIQASDRVYRVDLGPRYCLQTFILLEQTFQAMSLLCQIPSAVR